jgi:cell division protease FtsH
MLLGGHTAEELVFHEMSTGASHDIKQATDLARRMVTNYGMSDKLGPRTFGDKQEMVFLGREIAEQRDYSERMALEIDREVSSIIAGGLETARKILSENKARLTFIAEQLVNKETLEGEELEKAFTDPISPSGAVPAEAALAPAPASAVSPPVAAPQTAPATRKPEAPGAPQTAPAA